MFYESCVSILILIILAEFAITLLCPSRSDAQLLICSTSHTRFFPVKHSFTYPLVYVFFPIDNPGENIFFAVDKWRIFHVRSGDYLGSPPCGPGLIEKLRWHLEQHVYPC